MKCEGKIPYDTAEAAFTMSMRLRRYGMKVEGYQCPLCGRWHVGRAKPGDRNGLTPKRYNARTNRRRKLILKKRREDLRLSSLEDNHDS